MAENRHTRVRDVYFLLQWRYSVMCSTLIYVSFDFDSNESVVNTPDIEFYVAHISGGRCFSKLLASRIPLPFFSLTKLPPFLRPLKNNLLPQQNSYFSFRLGFDMSSAYKNRSIELKRGDVIERRQGRKDRPSTKDLPNTKDRPSAIARLHNWVLKRCRAIYWTRKYVTRCQIQDYLDLFLWILSSWQYHWSNIFFPTQNTNTHNYDISYSLSRTHSLFSVHRT